MYGFGRIVVRFRVPIILMSLLLTGFLAERTLHLGVNSDLISYLPQDSAAVRMHQQVSDTFGGNDLVVVALEDPRGDIFRPEVLGKLAMLTTAYETLTYEDDQGTHKVARHVISLTNTMDIHGDGDDVTVGDLIDPEDLPTDAGELERLKRYTLSKDLYNGRLVSREGGISAIILRLATGADSGLSTAAIQEVTDKVLGDGETAPSDALKATYAGMPVWNHGLNRIIFSDMKILIPLVGLLVIFILFLSFRNLRGVLLPLATVVMSSIWTMGIMELFGVKLTMISNVIPVLLIAVGSAYGIHLLNRYREEVDRRGVKLDRGKELDETVASTIGAVGLPIFLAGATTLVGFLSFLTAYLTLVKSFGIFCAIGVGAALLISLTFLPAVLSLLPTPPPRPDRWSQSGDRLVNWMSRLGQFTLAHVRGLAILMVVLSVVSILGVFHLTRNVNMVEYFKPGHPVRVGDQVMREHLGGATPIQVLVEGDIRDPELLKEIFLIEKYMASLPHISNVQSMATFIAHLNQEMYGNYAIPDSRDKVGALWLKLEGQKLLEQLVSADEKRALITGTIAGIDSYIMIDLANQLDGFIGESHLGRWTLLEVASDGPSSAPAKALVRKRVARELRLDLMARLPAGSTLPFDLEALLDHGLDDALTPGESQALVQAKVEAMMRYIQGLQSEVEPDNEGEVARLRQGFQELFGREAMPVPATLRQVLETGFDRETYEDDPEALDEMAGNLRTPFLEEAVQRFYVQRVLSNLLAAMPRDWSSDAWMTRNLKGDLWTLWDRTVAQADPEAPVSATFGPSGMPFIYRELDRSLVSSQVQSLIIALLLVFLMLTLQFRSIVAGLVGIAPISVSVLLNFAIMALADVPLDISTVLIASLAVGIGIDYTIHYMSRLRVETLRGGDIGEAVLKTTRTSGTAVAINAVSVAAGFITLLFASLVPMQHFGWMTAMTMIVSALAALLIVPVIVMRTGVSRFLNRP